jgi:hypothetical protein
MLLADGRARDDVAIVTMRVDRCAQALTRTDPAGFRPERRPADACRFSTR